MSQHPAWIAAEELAERIGGPHAPCVVDVRRRLVFEASEWVIATARWRDHQHAARWVSALSAGQETVIYCVHGHQVSQSAAGLLAANGIRARYLRGGIEAFHATGGSCVARHSSLHDRHASSRWVSAERPGVDALASAWLIRRFLDPDAQLLFTAHEQVHAVADEVSGAVFATHSEAGDGFSAILRRYSIGEPALQTLAAVVQNTARMNGLPAICDGLLRIHRNDVALTAAAMAIFDAYFQWARSAPSHTEQTPH